MILNEHNTSVDVDYWIALSNSDPEAFEELRLACIEELISKASNTQRQRLRGLQWRIDLERDRANTPLAACMTLSSMMWEQVTGKDGFLESLQQMNVMQTLTEEPAEHVVSAAIIPFSTKIRPN